MVSNVAYPLDNEQQAAIEWFEDRFGSHVPVGIIRSRAAIKRAMRDSHSVFAEAAEETDMTDVFAEIAAEVAP